LKGFDLEQRRRLFQGQPIRLNPSHDEKTKEPYGHEEEVFWKRELTEPLQSEDMTSEEFESVAAEINNLKVFKTKNAAPATGPFPVILFEHGFGVTVGSYQHMILELVSHGYIVLAPSHPHIADTVIFEDGREAFLKSERNALMFETAFLDAQFILEKMDEISSTVPSMDLTKIGMIGHSLGGATTIRITRVNPLIKAGISLDAPVHHNTYDYDGDERNSSTLDSDITLDYGSDFAKPFLHIFAEKPMCDPSTVHLATHNFKAIVKGMEHNSFADHGFLKDNISVFKSKGWHLGAGNAKALSYYPELNSLILAFFDNFLKAAQVDPMNLNSDVITIETTKD
jgi:dienelactone hydrolase